MNKSIAAGALVNYLLFFLIFATLRRSSVSPIVPDLSDVQIPAIVRVWNGTCGKPRRFP